MVKSLRMAPFYRQFQKKLKLFLLYKGQSNGSVRLGHLTTLKKKYNEIKFDLEKISYKQHQSIISIDLKIIGFSSNYKVAAQNFRCVCGTARQKKSTGKERLASAQ